MRTYVVARYSRKLNDWELKAINGIIYGRVYVFRSNNIPILEAEKMFDEFIEEHPETEGWDLRIENDM